MTEKPVKVYPFLRQGNTTLAVSWLLSYDVNTSHLLDLGIVRDAAASLGLHPISLKRQLSRIRDNKYFSLQQKREGGIILSRSEIPVSLCYSFLPQSLLQELSASESTLLATLAFYKRNNKPVPPRHILSARTGFSMRQVAYSLKSLTEKGLFVSTPQHESYVRHSQEKGRIEDVRDRMSYTLSDKAFRFMNKIAPLKDIIRFPVKNRSLQQSKFFDELFNFYGNHFHVHPFESVSGCRKYFHDHGDKTLSNDQLLEAVKKASTNRFLKLANRFGWQEGVTACYECKGYKEYLTDNSYHINKYKAHKPGLGWILVHAKDILDGKYDERAGENTATVFPFNKKRINQKEASLKGPINPHIYNRGGGISYMGQKPENINRALQRENPVSHNIEHDLMDVGNKPHFYITGKEEKNKDVSLPSNTIFPLQKPTLLEEIHQTYEDKEREVRLKVLKQIGEGLYRKWIKPCKLLITQANKVNLKSPNRFIMDMIYQKVIFPLNLQNMIQVE